MESEKGDGGTMGKKTLRHTNTNVLEANYEKLCFHLAKKEPRLRKIKAVTSRKGNGRVKAWFESLKERLKQVAVRFRYEFREFLHDREIR